MGESGSAGSSGSRGSSFGGEGGAAALEKYMWSSRGKRSESAKGSGSINRVSEGSGVKVAAAVLKDDGLSLSFETCSVGMASIPTGEVT